MLISDNILKVVEDTSPSILMMYGLDCFKLSNRLKGLVVLYVLQYFFLLWFEGISPKLKLFATESQIFLIFQFFKKFSYFVQSNETYKYLKFERNITSRVFPTSRQTYTISYPFQWRVKCKSHY